MPYRPPLEDDSEQLPAEERQHGSSDERPGRSRTAARHPVDGHIQECVVRSKLVALFVTMLSTTVDGIEYGRGVKGNTGDAEEEAAEQTLKNLDPGYYSTFVPQA